MSWFTHGRVETEIVYVINAGYASLLRISLDSLLRSGSRFDSVRIYLVGCSAPEWRVNDPRVKFEEVDDCFPDDFLRNKTCMANSPGERLVFLDADTLVLGRLEEVYAGLHDDFLGRVANPYLRPDWNRDAWEEACRRLGGRPVPYFNSGFVVFQNSSHRKIARLWPEIIRCGSGGILFDAGSLHTNPKYHRDRYLEQLSLSLSVAAAGLSWRNMAPQHHAWAWNQEPHRDATVYHTAGPKFLARAGEIYRELGLGDDFSRMTAHPDAELRA